jgi:hypothetical protein
MWDKLVGAVVIPVKMSPVVGPASSKSFMDGGEIRSRSIHAKNYYLHRDLGYINSKIADYLSSHEVESFT